MVHRKVHYVEIKARIPTIYLVWLAPCTFISILHSKTKPAYSEIWIQSLVGGNLTVHPRVFFKWTILPLKNIILLLRKLTFAPKKYHSLIKEVDILQPHIQNPSLCNSCISIFHLHSPSRPCHVSSHPMGNVWHPLL